MLHRSFMLAGNLYLTTCDGNMLSSPFTFNEDPNEIVSNRAASSLSLIACLERRLRNRSHNTLAAFVALKTFPQSSVSMLKHFFWSLPWMTLCFKHHPIQTTCAKKTQNLFTSAYRWHQAILSGRTSVHCHRSDSVILFSHWGILLMWWQHGKMHLNGRAETKLR